MSRQVIESALEQMKRRYDPEHDLHTPGPVVTWSDSRLMDAIEALLEMHEREVSRLEAKIARIERGLGLSQ